LKADLDRRIEEIRQKYKEPPPIQEKKPRFERREQRPERREQRWQDKKWRKDRRARKG
jgi:RNA processing factor Prp31